MPSVDKNGALGYQERGKHQLILIQAQPIPANPAPIVRPVLLSAFMIQ